MIAFSKRVFAYREMLCEQVRQSSIFRKLQGNKIYRYDQNIFSIIKILRLRTIFAIVEINNCNFWKIAKRSIYFYNLFITIILDFSNIDSNQNNDIDVGNIIILKKIKSLRQLRRTEKELVRLCYIYFIVQIWQY